MVYVNCLGIMVVEDSAAWFVVMLVGLLDRYINLTIKRNYELPKNSLQM